MITSPSFYKSIHKAEERNQLTLLKRNSLRFVKRNMVKIVVSFAVFIILFTSFLIMDSVASVSHPMEATADEQVVTVSTGDTLWGIARSYSDGSDDIRFIIYKIKDRNGLQTVDLKPGQKIIIPII